VSASKSSSLFWAVVTLVGLTVMVYLVYEVVIKQTSPCESIFEQTAMQFELKLKRLETEGGIVLGRQQIQELSDNAQVTALNLKTCCIVLDAGKVNPEQFLQCQNTGRDYEEKLNSIIQQISKVEKAEVSDNQAALQALKESINATLQEAKQISSQLRRKVSEITPKLTEKAVNEVPAPLDRGTTPKKQAISRESAAIEPATEPPRVVLDQDLKEPNQAIKVTKSVLPTISILPITRFSQPLIKEVLIVKTGTKLRSFIPAQRADKFNVPMVIEPGSYDIILDPDGQSMFRLVEGLEIKASQKVTIDPNPFLSFILPRPLTLDGFSPLEKSFLMPAGSKLSGFFYQKQSSKQMGLPLLIEAGHYDVYAEPAGGSFIALAKNVEVVPGLGVEIDTNAKVGAIVHDDPQIEGFKIESIYLVSAGTDIKKRHTIIQQVKQFGAPLLVTAGGHYDLVLKPMNGSAVKVQQDLSPAAGQIMHFGGTR